VKILMKTLLLSVVLLCIAVQAQALDREVQIDILTSKITTLLKAGKNAEALQYFAELEGMQATLPESFDFFYIDTLDKSGKADKALERSEEYLKKYGKKGKYYGQVIEIVSRRSMEVEAQSKAAAAEKLAGEFITVPGGCFETSGTRVCLDAFRIGKYEVTQGQYTQIMGSNPSSFKSCGDTCPVEEVSWNDAQSFISRLNSQTGRRYRLPTEAEWEYACRSGGKQEEYCGGNIDAVAWYDGNSGKTTHPVGLKQPNGLGIYDMSGNVLEWLQDWHDVGSYPSSDSNPTGPSSGSKRVLRGGSWFNRSVSVRFRFRVGEEPTYRHNNLGFRLVLSSQD